MKTQDFVRQSANLILAPAMWVTSSLGFFTDDARTAGEFSDLSDNLLVPFPAAFSIWFPIFIGCIAYGIIQALPKNRQRDIFRRSGWWSAFGFACICGWALITAYAPTQSVQWGTALIFIPAVGALIMAAIRLSGFRQSMSAVEKWGVYVSVSLIAGWCSIAIFLNWTPIAYETFASGNANVFSSLSVLTAALGFAVLVSRKMPRNFAYFFPLIWGLTFLAVRHLAIDSSTPLIGWSALIGVALLILTAVLGRPRQA